ncbi:Uncharacterised protein [uncultured archaeon]|nr:Uncharacterised protein [uncultured archaeon]
MAVKDDLKKKVADFVKETPEWPVFLRWISQNDIKTRAQLKSVLNAEIKDYDQKLKFYAMSREGRNVRLLRPCAKKLDFLKLCRDKIVKYL